AEWLLGNQVEETVFLAQQARRLGAIAASAFGAGFGGSVWALITAGEAEAFAAAWAERYAAAFPEAAQRADFFTERPGPGAFRLDG
ncbi:MAG: galactokinase family protein, partial [Rhodothermales bacterium]